MTTSTVQDFIHARGTYNISYVLIPISPSISCNLRREKASVYAVLYTLCEVLTSNDSPIKLSTLMRLKA